MSLILPLLAVPCLAFAPAPFLQTRARVEGEWEGRSPMLIKGNRLTYHPAGPTPSVYRLRLYPSARPPAYDLLSVYDGYPVYFKGIYKVEGDTLTLCYGEAVRPAQFGPAGGGTFVEAYRRKKP